MSWSRSAWASIFWFGSQSIYWCGRARVRHRFGPNSTRCLLSLPNLARRFISGGSIWFVLQGIDIDRRDYKRSICSCIWFYRYIARGVRALQKCCKGIDEILAHLSTLLESIYIRDRQCLSKCSQCNSNSADLAESTGLTTQSWICWSSFDAISWRAIWEFAALVRISEDQLIISVLSLCFHPPRRFNWHCVWKEK